MKESLPDERSQQRDEIDTKTMSSVLEDEKQEDETSSEDVDHLEGESFSSDLNGSFRHSQTCVDTVDTVMSDAVQRCLAMYAYDGAQNSARLLLFGSTSKCVTFS